MNFHAYVATALVLVAITMSWLIPPAVDQPDWAFAILLGAMLAHWRYIVWILPLACVHDLTLYWTLWPGILLWLLLPLLLIWMDELAGAGLPQRVLLLLLAHATLLTHHCSWSSLLLTLLLSVFCWYAWIAFSDRLHYSRLWQS